MEFECSCGASFLLCGHLWVIISDPFSNPKQVIFVLLTSLKSGSDTTVVLSPGDHRFIRHDTVISYADSRIEEIDYIKESILQRNFEPKEKFEESVTKKIQQGLLNSPRTPKQIKETYKKYFGQI